MRFGPFFLGIFAAVLFANLATLGLVMLAQGSSTAQPFQKLEQLFPSSKQSREHRSTDGLIDVTFRNLSDKQLRCSTRPYAEYVPMLNLQGHSEKRFDGFTAGTHARCSINTNAKGHTTFLTYFVVDKAGVYELWLDRVPCEDCKTNRWRWATVVVDPSGKPEDGRHE